MNDQTFDTDRPITDPNDPTDPTAERRVGRPRQPERDDRRSASGPPTGAVDQPVDQPVEQVEVRRNVILSGLVRVVAGRPHLAFAFRVFGDNGGAIDWALLPCSGVITVPCTSGSRCGRTGAPAGRGPARCAAA